MLCLIMNLTLRKVLKNFNKVVDRFIDNYKNRGV